MEKVYSFSIKMFSLDWPFGMFINRNYITHLQYQKVFRIKCYDIHFFRCICKSEAFLFRKGVWSKCIKSSVIPKYMRVAILSYFQLCIYILQNVY